MSTSPGDRSMSRGAAGPWGADCFGNSRLYIGELVGRAADFWPRFAPGLGCAPPAPAPAALHCRSPAGATPGRPTTAAGAGIGSLGLVSASVVGPARVEGGSLGAVSVDVGGLLTMREMGIGFSFSGSSVSNAPSGGDLRTIEHPIMMCMELVSTWHCFLSSRQITELCVISVLWWTNTDRIIYQKKLISVPPRSTK